MYGNSIWDATPCSLETSTNLSEEPAAYIFYQNTWCYSEEDHCVNSSTRGPQKTPPGISTLPKVGILVIINVRFCFRRIYFSQYEWSVLNTINAEYTSIASSFLFLGIVFFYVYHKKLPKKMLTEIHIICHICKGVSENKHALVIPVLQNKFFEKSPLNNSILSAYFIFYYKAKFRKATKLYLPVSTCKNHKHLHHTRW